MTSEDFQRLLNAFNKQLNELQEHFHANRFKEAVAVSKQLTTWLACKTSLENPYDYIEVVKKEETVEEPSEQDRKERK